MQGGAWGAAAALVALALAVPAAGAQGPLEIDILEGYLAEHDKVPRLPHCGRHDGHVLVPGPGQQPLATGGTNTIMEEHKDWHVDHEGVPGSQDSPDDADRFGDHFVYWHRDFLGRYEAWRAANGQPVLQPWDPGTPMPPELAYEFPGRGCLPGRQSDPGIALPTWATVAGGSEQDPIFGYTHLCAFPDMNRFGKALAREYHPRVHARLGGDMSAGQGPRDPAFWAFHRFVDDVALSWEHDCATETPPETREENGRAFALPGPGVAFVLGALAVAIAARRPRSS